VLRGYGYWEKAIGESHRNDAGSTHELLRAAERHGAQWFDVASGEYYASAADCLGRVGDMAGAWQCLEKGLADPQDASHLLAMSRGALLARSGDPVQAEEVLLAAPTLGVQPREYWRISLFRALAAFRRGDKRAGGLAARAFEEAANLGLAELPLTKERAVTEELLGLAIETGRPAALALEVTALPTTVSVLGDFSLTSGGRAVAVTPGQGTKLLKLLAVSQGRLPTEQLIDSLWPDADREAGRNRLRTVLTRLRSEIGDVVVREGETILLTPNTRVDLMEFEKEARRALALGSGEPTLAVAWARAAIARYRGEVLADEAYEDWAVRPREWARRTMLQLLDLCADVARVRGDLDEMRRVLETTIDLAPYEDDRYLRAASLLIDQGQRAAALTVLRRARSALAELGLDAPASLARLERQIVA
jgi:DNA-binding SARP family transcriptional activator